MNVIFLILKSTFEVMNDPKDFTSKNVSLENNLLLYMGERDNLIQEIINYSENLVFKKNSRENGSNLPVVKHTILRFIKFCRICRYFYDCNKIRLIRTMNVP